MVESNKKKGRVVVRSALQILVAQKGMNEKRNITNREIAKATGLSPNTVGTWMSPANEIKHVHSDVIVALCNWVPCDISDLLYLDSIEQ